MSVNSTQHSPARRIQLKKGSLRIRWRMAIYEYRFDERYVGWERQGVIDRDSHKYDLWQFLAVPTTETTSDESSAKGFRFGCLLLAASFVTFFSAIQPAVPLLAPALVIIGSLSVASALFGMRRVTRTQFYRDGQVLISIPHGEILHGDLDAFVEGLAAAIQRDRHRVYESDVI